VHLDRLKNMYTLRSLRSPEPERRQKFRFADCSGRVLSLPMRQALAV
jgi:hypothetical protein